MAHESALVMFVLLLLLGIAGGTFVALVWRETSTRRSVALAEWARASGFYSNPLAKLRPPPPLERFGTNLRIRHCLSSATATVVSFTTDRLPANPDAPVDLNAAPPMPPQFHALIWAVKSDWPAIALRPTAAPAALSDLLHLPSQAARYGTLRFVIFSDHRRTAHIVASSRLRGLLPADIGLLLIGNYLLLDFSSRPFDGIELNRMIVIAEQIVSHMPAIN